MRRFCRAPHPAADKVEDAWFDRDTPRTAVVHKEDALIAEEWLTPEREISPSLGRYFALEHHLVAAYDNLCRVDVLPWITAPPPAADVIFTLYEDGPGDTRVARVVAPLRALPHDGWQRFEFRPIPNSRGRSYRVTIEPRAFDLVGRRVRRAAELAHRLDHARPRELVLQGREAGLARG